MGKAPEALDDYLVAQRVVVLFVAERAHQLAGALLVGERLAVLERKVGEDFLHSQPVAVIAALDGVALAAARHAIDSGYDRGWLRVEKIFAYLPFEHSESLDDQERACDLMRPLGDEQYDYALRHKAIIERFGRFPHRNAVLGRESTPEEIEFLKQPGSGF